MIGWCRTWWPKSSARKISTAWGDGLDLRVAVDYSARAAILEATRKLPPGGSDTDLAALIAGESGDVDLLIRTGNESSALSDFLLWECSYAELYFALFALGPISAKRNSPPRMAEFRRRDRRFGGAPTRAAHDAPRARNYTAD